MKKSGAKWSRTGILATAVLLAAFLGGRGYTGTCVLCESLPCHGVCLLNLATGELGEMKLYEPHATKVAEIDPNQNPGAFSMQRIAGTILYGDTWQQSAYLYLPIKQKRMDKRYFCRDCRERLKEYRLENFVLADLYRRGEPQFYTVKNGVVYQIRCYCITITTQNGAAKLTVTGNARKESP